MFPQRGVRTLPRLSGDDGVKTDERGRDLDVQMLYDYLHELGGICALHTSATAMGTDWRENDPQVEPFVEIYQGDRDSYESFGAPRVAHGPGDAVGGWRPLGMVWTALALQYRLGFQASSDHISTHISFAVAIAESATRAAILDAFQRPPLLCGDRQHRPRRPLRRPPDGRRVHHSGARDAQGPASRHRADPADRDHQGFPPRLLDRARQARVDSTWTD